MRVTINLPESALKLADEGAAALCISRSAYISVALAEKARNDALASTLPAAVAELSRCRKIIEEQNEEQSENGGGSLLLD